MKKIKIGDKLIGNNQPPFIVGEIGINHNGSVDIAKKLIDTAKSTGCDAVKFQKRTIDIVYTREELERPRPNPFGETNGDLKRGLEFSFEQYKEIDKYCKEKDIIWFASCWDEDSVDFIEQFNPPCYKIASASLTDNNLVKYTALKGKPVLLSTGMSTIGEICGALDVIESTGNKNIVIMQCTSTYPNETEELDLNVIKTFKEKFDYLVGYSGHEKGLTPSIIACVLGACIVERHFTLDRTMWGSDHAASLEPIGLFKLCRDIKAIKDMLGDSEKRVHEREISIKEKLRRI